jgi:hypothetical protein
VLAWHTRAPVPTPRSEVAAAAAGGEIYVIGGFAEGLETVRKVEVYTVATNTWITGPRLPIGVNHPMATSFDGEIYVFGGYRGPGLTNRTKRAFVLRNGGWRSLPNMPGPRAAGGAAVASGKLYVVGGTAPGGLARRTFVFKPKIEKWDLSPALRTPRQHMGVASHDGFVYGIAGRLGGLTTNLDAAERFNPKTGRWRFIDDVPTPRGGLAAAATDNGLIVVPGGEEQAGTFEEVEAYNTRTRRWRSLPDLPTPRHGLGVVAVGNRIFTLAGGPQPGGTYSDANEVINLSSLGGGTP